MSDAVSLDFKRRPSALPYMLRAMLPVSRRFTLSPGVSATWLGHHVDPCQLADFLKITGLAPSGTTLPLLYPHVFGFRLAMAILTHPEFPVPIWGVLQTRNRLQQYRSIDAAEPLDLKARILRGRAVPKGAEFDLHTTVHVDGELAWESLVTFFARGRFGEPDAAAPASRSPTDTGRPTAEWIIADTGNWSFGRFTGDYNGIHFWDWYARRFGFRRGLYHPPRLLGECLAHLPWPLDPGPARLDAWIKGPVAHGARVQLCAGQAADHCSFALFAGDARPSIVGRLQRPEAELPRIAPDPWLR